MPQESASSTLRWNQSGHEQVISAPLQGVVHQTSQTPKRIVVALHGFGDNAANFSSLTQELSLPDTLWIVLQAPESVPFAIDGGQWYELFGNPHPQFKRSCEKIRMTLEAIQAASEIEWTKFFLLGFSQGSFMSLFTALTMTPALAGVIALSGYLAQSHRLSLPHDKRKSLPIFLAHGLSDQVVFPSQHFETLDILSHLGFSNVTAKTYKGVAHTLCSEELYDIKSFIEGHS